MHLQQEIKLSNKMLFLIWIVCTGIWVGSYLPELQLSLNAYEILGVFVLRFILVLVAVASFFTALTNIAMSQKNDDFRLKYLQIISICAAAICLGLGYFSENFNVNYSVIQILGIVIISSCLVNVSLFIVTGLWMLRQRRFNILFLPQIIVSAMPIFWLLVLILFACIGFGPPS